MIVSIVVAMGANRVIGKNNQLLWKLPGDLKKFKDITLGHTIIMGRKTFESIGRVLPGRKSIVVSRSEFSFPEVQVARSVEAALELARMSGETEACVIGGGQIYEYALARGLVQKIYLTRVNWEGAGDAFFPEVNPYEWHRGETELHYKSQIDPLDWSFQVWEKRGGAGTPSCSL